MQKTDLSAVPYLEPEPFPLEADGKTVDLGGSWLRHWILWLQELSIANMKETASYCLYKQSHSAKQQAQTYRLF